MGRIQSNIGLITGVPITDTVEKLLELARRPRDLLVSRTSALKNQQVAVGSLTALVIGIQLAARNLAKSSVFTDHTVTSSNPAVLSASKNGNPAVGTYSFTPVQQAQSHQVLSSAVAADQPLGEGSLALRFGGFIDTGLSLDVLNGGGGVQRGKIRITDRSGASEIIDLQFARNVDDVLQAINNATAVNVSATAEGDAIRLTDLTGQTAGNLRVQEVGGGRTAADLGLATIDSSASTALGRDVLSLASSTRLELLNDGNGVGFRSSLAELEVSFRDGSSPLQVDFGDFSRGIRQAQGTTQAANGANAQVTFRAVTAGAAADGVRVRFIDSGAATQPGQETVQYDSSQKLLTFDIASGQSTADDIVAALSNSSVSSQFTATSGGDGQGIVALADTAVFSGGAAVAAPSKPTLGDVVRVLNEADPARLTARIRSDGEGIELIDKTSGSETFAVRSLFGGTTAEELGLTGTSSNGVLQGQRLLSGLKTTLLRTLNGGRGLGPLGQISITDRNGATATVDLSSAVTLDDVVSIVNGSGVQVTARINRARNGLELVDTSPGTGHLIVASSDASNAAEKLKIAVNAAVSSVNSGTLDRQVINQRTLLSQYRNGEPVRSGSFTITDTTGQVRAINFSVLQPKTVGDVLDAINGAGLALEARINDAGDGIALVDTAGGAGDILVADSGSGKAAADLGIAGQSQTVTVNGAPTKVLAGSTTIRIDVSATDTLADVARRINDLQARITASVFREGIGDTARLSLASQVSGKAGEMLIDDSAFAASFFQTTAARDALVLVGGTGAGESGVLVASSSNTFEGLVDGLNVTVSGSSPDPVRVTVSRSSKSLVTNVKLLVTKYNELVDKLKEWTKFDPTTSTTGVLFGTTEVLQVESGLAGAFTGRYFGVGRLRNVAQLGITVRDTGKLDLDEAKLTAAFDADPAQVEEFFTKEKLGFAAKLDTLIERLAGAGNSLLVNRNQSLQRRIENTSGRVDGLNKRLDHERERLLTYFFRLETTIARMQDNLSAISSLQPIPPLGSRS
jgi:flagellar hook-associated protein 2